MSLTIILSIIIIILIMAMVLNQKFMKDRVETEEYARNQLISKNSILSEENLSLKNQMLSTNNDVGQHAFKNAKRELRKILNRFKEEGRLRSYTIVPTSNLAVKHPLFEYARSFDFIIITDVGLINVDVKNWNQKRFIILMCQINILKKDNHNIIPKKLSVIILAIDIIVSLKQHVLVSILLLRFYRIIV